MQDAVQDPACRPSRALDSEPMFDSRKTIAARLADAADLLLDFATLGEYGLEPEIPGPGCESRSRPPRVATEISARPGRSRTKRDGLDTVPA